MTKVYNTYDDKYWEEVILLEYKKEGSSRKKIKNMFNVSTRDVSDRFKGLKRVNLNDELVVQKYMELRNVSCTAQFFNVSVNTIHRLLLRLNVTIRPVVRKNRPSKWSEDELNLIIPQYETRKDLRKNNPPVFNAAARFGLLPKFFPFEFSKRFRHIYVFLFHNTNVAYVGLSCNVKERYKSHLKPNLRSPLFNYINKTNETFKFRVLTDTPLPELIAADKEREIIGEYKLNGWTLLNRNKGGGLGGIPIWTYEKLKELSLTYTHQRDFILNEKRAYEYAQKIGVLNDICSHMVKTRNQSTYDEMLVEAKKYTNIRDFKENSKTIYYKSKRLGIISEITLHMRNGRPTRFNYELVQNEAKKYNTRAEFQKKSRSEYTHALKKGILNDICSHMKIMKNNWSIEDIFEISKQYDSLINLKKGNNSVYYKAVKLGITNKLYPKNNLK